MSTATKTKIPTKAPTSTLPSFTRDQCRTIYGVSVTLRGYGNPDRDQYADTARVRVEHCESIAGAIDCVRAYITQNNLGGGNWGPQSGIVFCTETNKVFGRISYNGRFWPSTKDALMLVDA